jgi:pyroglutamyl-peptidase
MAGEAVILVTGFRPFGPHAVNPSEELAKAVDGRRIASCAVRGVVLSVDHAAACGQMAALLDETDPRTILHLGLAPGRARLALERVALNVLDFPLPDAEGCQPHDLPCVPGGPAAYWSRLPLPALLAALLARGIPAYVSDTAGTYVCNQVMYWTLHELDRRGTSLPAGLIHVPLLPAMVAAGEVDLPSMDFGLELRAVEVVLEVLAETLARS